INWEEVSHFFNFDTIAEEKRTNLETNIRLLVEEQLKLPSGQNLWKAFQFWEDQHPELGFQFEFALIDESEAYIKLKNYENQIFLFEIALNKVFAEDFKIPFWQVIKNNLHQKTNLGLKKLLNENMLYRPCLIKLVDPNDSSHWEYHLREQELPFFITLAHEFLHALNQLERITWILGSLDIETMEEFFAELNLINSNVCNENNLVCNILCLFNKEKLNKYNLLDFCKQLKMQYHRYRQEENSLEVLFEAILPIQKFLAKKLKLQNNKGILETRHKDLWQNKDNNDSLDEMTIILESERKIGEVEFVFIGETTFLREYYHDNAIISWSHFPARDLEFWQKMSAILQENYVQQTLFLFDLEQNNIQYFYIDEHQSIQEKYYFYKGNSYKYKKLQNYLQNELNIVHIPIEAIMLWENTQNVFLGGKIQKTPNIQFWHFIAYPTSDVSISLLPKYTEIKKEHDFYAQLKELFGQLDEEKINFIKL
ncbi:MAG: hypothetical protein ACLRFH_02365, partial [Opitutales bacterium]